MIAYCVRRLLYALPILLGVNIITFLLFFIVNSPDDMCTYANRGAICDSRGDRKMAGRTWL